MTRDNHPPRFKHSIDLPDLKARAFELLSQAGDDGVAPEELAGRFLSAARVPEAVAGKLLESLLSGDRRVERDSQGRYRIRQARASARGTPILEGDFCVIDVETTGVSKGSRIIEVGAVRVRGLEIGITFDSLVNVDVPIPAEITTLTGITADMVAGAPEPAEVLTGLLDFMGDAVFCAHNAPFDKRFIWGEVGRFLLQDVANPILCTRNLARRAFPDAGKYGLDALQEHLSMSNDARHRALGDAAVTAQLLVRCFERLMESGVETVEQLLKIQRKPGFEAFKNNRENGGAGKNA